MTEAEKTEITGKKRRRLPTNSWGRNPVTSDHENEVRQERPSKTRDTRGETRTMAR